MTASTNYLEAAQAVMPGRAAVVEALAAVRRRRRQVTASPSLHAVTSEVAAKAAAAVEAGKRLPENLGRQVLDAREATRTAEAEAEVLHAVTSRLESRLREIDRGHADTGLRHLAGLLDSLLDEVRTVDATLGPVTTAEQAVRSADTGAAWVRLDELVAAYASLRQAQHGLFQSATGGSGEMRLGDGARRVDLRALLDRVGELANVATVWPAFVVQFDGTGRRVPPPPWPHDPDHPHRLDYTRAYVRWAATSPTARVWLPTTAEAGQAWQASEDAIAAHQAQQRKATGPTGVTVHKPPPALAPDRIEEYVATGAGGPHDEW